MFLVNSIIGPDLGKITGDYLLTADSAHLGSEPSFSETRRIFFGDKCYKYWETNSKRYYGELETPTAFGATKKRFWYDMVTSEVRASQQLGEPVCFFDSGKENKPHRIGGPAWGTQYYIDGYRLPPEIGKVFVPDRFYTMTIKDGKLVFGTGNLHLKYTNGKLILHGEPVTVPAHMERRQVIGGWGMYKTVDEWIREHTVPSFDKDLPEYMASKSISWGY